MGVINSLFKEFIFNSFLILCIFKDNAIDQEPKGRLNYFDFQKFSKNSTTLFVNFTIRLYPAQRYRVQLSGRF